MASSGFTARQFFVWAIGGVVVFSGIVTVAALLTIAPWGGADERVRESLPAAQGETPAPDGGL